MRAALFCPVGGSRVGTEVGTEVGRAIGTEVGTVIGTEVGTDVAGTCDVVPRRVDERLHGGPPVQSPLAPGLRRLRTLA